MGSKTVRVGPTDIEVRDDGIILWDGALILSDMNLARIKEQPEFALAFMKNLVAMIETTQEEALEDGRGPLQHGIEDHVIEQIREQYDYIKTGAAAGGKVTINVKTELDPPIVKALARELEKRGPIPWKALS